MHSHVAGVAMLPVTDPPTPDYQILQLQERGIPVVFCHRGVDGVRAPTVVLDFHKCGCMQARALLEAGHRRFAFFAESDAKPCKLHEMGFKDELRANEHRYTRQVHVSRSDEGSKRIRPGGSHL